MNLLDNTEVINWCYKGITSDNLTTTSNNRLLEAAKREEDAWGNKITNGVGGQWTTRLCQDLVMEALIRLGRNNVKKAVPQKSSVRNKSYQPDLECDEFVYEVKGRNWTTTGTAGEKILGVPLKYGEVPRVYKKPLRIVLVGYQEYEAKNVFAFGDLLNEEEQTKELKASLEFYKTNYIEYVGFTEMLGDLGIKP
jgi:hypothetical protein